MVDFKKIRKGTIAALQTSFVMLGVRRMEIIMVETPTLKKGSAWQVKMFSKGDEFVRRFFVSSVSTSIATAIRECLKMLKDRQKKLPILVTEEQISNVNKIGVSLGFSRISIRSLCQQYFGCRLEEIAMVDASSIIDFMQVEAGRLKSELIDD